MLQLQAEWKTTTTCTATALRSPWSCRVASTPHTVSWPRSGTTTGRPCWPTWRRWAPHTLPFAWCFTEGRGGGGGGFDIHRNHKAYWVWDNNREALLAYVEKVGPTHPSFCMMLYWGAWGGDFTSTETIRLIGDGTTTGRPCWPTWRRWAPHTLLLPSSCMVLYGGGGGGGGGTFASSETIRLIGMTFTSSETTRLIGDGGQGVTFTSTETKGVLGMGDSGWLYIHRNHKAYWGWGTRGDLYIHRNHKAYGGWDSNQEAMLAYMEKVGPTHHPSCMVLLRPQIP